MKNRLVINMLCSLCVISSSTLAYGGGSHGHDHTHDHGAVTEGTGPFYGHLDVGVYGDRVMGFGSDGERFGEFYTHSDLELGLRLGAGFSINSILKLEGEPSGHSHGHHDVGEGKDRFFEDHMLYLDAMTLNYDHRYFSLYAGKFSPVVGFDAHLFPGIYTHHIIEDYGISERIGFGGALKYDAGVYGVHRLDVSTFFADTTALSDSLLHRRGRTRKEDGGVSNTEDFSSFAVSLGGSDFSGLLDGVSYRIGYAHQAAGIGDEKDETRYGVSLGYTYPVSHDLRIKLVGEHMAIVHFEGEADHDRAITTAALGLEYLRWDFGVSYTFVANTSSDPHDGLDGNIFGLSAGYTFENGIRLAVGYQRSNEGHGVTDRIGALVGYSYVF